MKKLFIFFVILIATVFNTNALENPTANRAIIKIADTLVHLPTKKVLDHLSANIYISSDGSKVADVKGGEISIFNILNNQKVIIKTDSSYYYAHDFNHDGTTFFVILSNHDTQAFDTTTGKLKFTLKAPAWISQQPEVNWATLNMFPKQKVFFLFPDDTHVVTYTDSSMYLWDAQTGQLLKDNTRFNNLTNWVASNRTINRRYLIDVQNSNAQDGFLHIHIIDALTLEKVNQFGVREETHAILLNHDATRLLLSGKESDSKLRVIQLLDIINKKAVFFKILKSDTEISFSADGAKTIFSIRGSRGSDGIIKIYDSKTGNILKTIFNDVAISIWPKLSVNGKLLFTVDAGDAGIIYLYNVNTGKLLYKFSMMADFQKGHLGASDKEFFIETIESGKIALYRVDISSFELYPQRDLESVERIVAYFNPKRSVETKSLLIKIDALAQQKPGATITKEDLDAESLKTAQEIPFEIQNALMNVYNIDKTVFGRVTYNQPEPAPLTPQETQADIAQSAAHKTPQKLFARSKELQQKIKSIEQKESSEETK